MKRLSKRVLERKDSIAEFGVTLDDPEEGLTQQDPLLIGWCQDVGTILGMGISGNLICSKDRLVEDESMIEK